MLHDAVDLLRQHTLLFPSMTTTIWGFAGSREEAAEIRAWHLSVHFLRVFCFWLECKHCEALSCTRN